MKLTLADAQNSRLPLVIGACATDPRFLQLLNEAMELLMYQGHFHNTTQFVRFCAVDGCVTQPPQVATIERVAVCGQPASLRTQWHEFLEGGIGVRRSWPNGGCGINEALFRGYYPTFGDIVGVNKKVHLVCDLANDVGKPVLVLGYDQNNNWIKTSQSGVILDGEIVFLAQGAGTDSNNFFSSVTDIQFNTDRDGQVWLYEKNNDTSILRLIGNYHSFETRPNYPRYLFPGIFSGADSNGACTQTLVEGIVKLNFWPVKTANDYLCIPCLPALKVMLQGLNEAEHEPDGVKKQQILAAGIAASVAILNSQNQHFIGDGVKVTLQVEDYGPATEPIPSLL